jgi:hypothetical protein
LRYFASLGVALVGAGLAIVRARSSAWPYLFEGEFEKIAIDLHAKNYRAVRHLILRLAVRAVELDAPGRKAYLDAKVQNLTRPFRRHVIRGQKHDGLLDVPGRDFIGLSVLSETGRVLIEPLHVLEQRRLHIIKRIQSEQHVRIPREAQAFRLAEIVQYRAPKKRFPDAPFARDAQDCGFIPR